MAVCAFCDVWFYPKYPWNKPKTCSRSCTQKLRQKNLGHGQTKIKKCLWCKTPFRVRGVAGFRDSKFCSRKCVGHYTMSLPENLAKVNSKERIKKLQKGFRQFIKTPAGEEYRRRTSERYKRDCPSRRPDYAKKYRSHPNYRSWQAAKSARMKKNNPSRNPRVMEKILKTKEMNGTLHVWKGKRGGNGQLTEPQKRLWTALGKDWQPELPIGLGTRQPGYPTKYAVDLGNTKIKVAIEIDGVTHQSKAAILLDAKKTKKLRELGWRVLRVTNQDVMTRLSQTLSRIKKEIRGL